MRSIPGGTNRMTKSVSDQRTSFSYLIPEVMNTIKRENNTHISLEHTIINAKVRKVILT